MTIDVLVISSDFQISRYLKKNFMDDVVEIHDTVSLEVGLYRLQQHSYGLLVLDISYRGEEGFRIIQNIRQISSVPMLVLSDDGAVNSKVRALHLGADDYLITPCDLDECLAQVHALLRRCTDLNNTLKQKSSVISYNGLLLDLARRIVVKDGEQIDLARKEYEIFQLLMENRTRVLTYSEIYQKVWNEAYLNDNSTIFYHVGKLRKKLGDSELIEAVYGVGYRLRS